MTTYVAIMEQIEETTRNFSHSNKNIASRKPIIRFMEETSCKQSNFERKKRL